MANSVDKKIKMQRAFNYAETEMYERENTIRSLKWALKHEKKNLKTVKTKVTRLAKELKNA